MKNRWCHELNNTLHALIAISHLTFPIGKIFFTTFRNCRLSVCFLLVDALTLSTKISPVVRFISNLLLAGLSGSIPCPVKKYTMFCGRSLSPSDAVTYISEYVVFKRQNIEILAYLNWFRLSIENDKNIFIWKQLKMIRHNSNQQK